MSKQFWHTEVLYVVLLLLLLPLRLPLLLYLLLTLTGINHTLPFLSFPFLSFPYRRLSLSVLVDEIGLPYFAPHSIYSTDSNFCGEFQPSVSPQFRPKHTPRAALALKQPILSPSIYLQHYHTRVTLLSENFTFGTLHHSHHH